MNKQVREEIIEQVTDGIYEAYPEIMERFGEAGRKRCVEDNHHHFDHLQTATELNQPEVFTNYAVWLTNLLTQRGMNKQHVIDNFQRIHDALNESTDLDASGYQKLLKAGINQIK
jgi:hypothetical protein